VAHPDWFEGDVAADWQPGPFYGARLCLGSPEAKQWAIAKTQWLASHHKLDYLKRVAASLRVDAPGVGHDPDPVSADLGGERSHDIADKIGRVAEFWAPATRAGEQRERDLGEVVEHQEVELAAAHELCRPGGAVAPESAAAPDAHPLFTHLMSAPHLVSEVNYVFSIVDILSITH
jgi:hypothetical protein